MINRVTETIKFNMLTNNMFNIQSEYSELMEKLSTQKMINRPSDDPIGTNDILDHRTAIRSIDQFKTNITDANIWLTLTETNLSGLRNIVDEAKAIAISESGAGADSETRAASVATLESLIEEALSIMNAKNGDNYIFAGSSTDIQPFSSEYVTASVDVSAAQTNTYSGTVTLGGAYIPTENKSYVVRIVDGGNLTLATYQISTDGGKTWGTTSNPGDLSGGTINNLGGDDIDINFSAGTFVANDIFTVSSHAAGYYSGNDDPLKAVIGKNNDMVYNITGAEAFIGQFADASVTNPILDDDTIVLTRGATAGIWTITSQTGNPQIVGTPTEESLMIDADGDNVADLTVNLIASWGQGNTINLSLTAGVTSGNVPATFSGSGSVDLLASLNALKSALQENNQDRAEALIAAQVENLQIASINILQYETQAGAKMQSLKVTGSNHDSVKLQITNMLADTENADLTKLITAFQMKQIAMEASYSMASKIGEMTIMDYI